MATMHMQYWQLIVQIKIQRTMEPSEPQCQVCFTASTPPTFHQTIIRCIKCNKTAHRYCYLPSCVSLQFVCDACQNNYKGVCSICENPGLLKKVDEHYGHPVCLIFSQSYLVSQFSNLSFMKVDSPKGGKRVKCLQCGLSNANVISCGLSCSKMCHIYCALKSYNPNDSSGWRVCLHICAGSSNYADLFESIVNRTVVSQHKYLRRKLAVSKISKNNLPVQIYCEQHAMRVIDCKCMDLDGEKDQWIYCDGCSRWQHLQCVEGAQALKAIEADKLYLCDECIKWRQAISQYSLVIPEQLPKLHIYDFVLIQYRIQQNYYQISPNLLQVSLKLPLLPGKQYIENEYRKEIAKRLRPKIDLSNIRRQIKVIKDQNKYVQVNKMGTTFMKEKEQIIMIWLLCESDLLTDKEGRQAQFIKKLQEQSMNVCIVTEIIDLLINYEKRFIGGKSDQLKSIRQNLQILGPDQTTKSLISYPNKSKQDHNKITEKTKVEKTISEQLKKLLTQLKNKINKQTIEDALLQIFKLVNSPHIIPHHNILPKIPIVYACTTFKGKQQALKYMNGLAQIQQIKMYWKRLNDTRKIANVNCYYKTKDKFIYQVDVMYSNLIINEKNSKVRTQLLKQWNRCAFSQQIPSRESCLDQPYQLIVTLNDQNISINKVKQTLLQYQQRRLLNLKDKKVNSCIKQLCVLQKLLEMMGQFKFTRNSLVKVKSLCNNCWSGQFTSYIPNILVQFQRLYTLTQRILFDYGIIHIDEQLCFGFKDQICLFHSWSLCSQQLYHKQTFIERCLMYFKDIQGIRLHLLTENVQISLKEIMEKIAKKVQQRTPIFNSESQYKLLNKWFITLQISNSKINAIFDKDRKFIQKLNLLKIQFDNLQMIEQLDKLLTQHLPFFQNNQLGFRVHQIRVLLTWIDLHKTILQKVPPHLLLSAQQALRLDNKDPQKPDFYTLRQIHNIMNKVQFPQCLFLQKFTKIIEEGEIYHKMVNKVLDCCSWNYDLQISLDWQKKLSIEQFQSIRQSIRNCMFYFQAELIEFNIIKDKFNHAEIQAKMLIIQYQKNQQTVYLHEKARKLITSLGCFPIISEHTKYLWRIIQNPKLQGLPHNLQQYVADIAKTHRLYSWQWLDELRRDIYSKIQSKFIKKDICNQLSNLIAHNLEFCQKYKFYYDKNMQNSVLSLHEHEAIQSLIKQYKELQFQDQFFEVLKSRYEYYQIIQTQIKRKTKYHNCDEKQLRQLQNALSSLHNSFFTEEIIKYKQWIDSKLDKAAQPERNNKIIRKQYSDNSNYSAQHSDISSFSASNKKTGYYNKLGRPPSTKKYGKDDISPKRDKRIK